MKDFDEFSNLLSGENGLLDKVAKAVIKDNKHITFDEMANIFINILGLYHEWINLSDGQMLLID